MGYQVPIRYPSGTHQVPIRYPSQTKTRTEPSGTIYTFTQGFTWNDLGKLASQSYPDSDQFSDTARTVSYTYTNGFLTGVPSFTTSISYYPNMMVNVVTHANGVTDTYGADPSAMQRPASIATVGATQNWSSGTYAYDGAGNIKAIGADYYTYDKVSRVVEGAPRGATKKQRYTFDAFGNMTKIETWNGSTWDPKNTTTSGTTNRIQGTCPYPVTAGDMAASYDAAGSMTSWNRCDVGVVANYTYYPTSMMRTLTLGGISRDYRYSVDNERVVTRTPGTPDKLTFTLRGLDGKVLRIEELTGTTWTWVKDYVYRGGLLLAEVESGYPTEPRHFSLDHLGSVRLITKNTGTYVNYHAYYAFGEEAGTTADSEAMKFTGHECDLQGTPSTPTDDLCYMHARYYNQNIARFLSVDPVRGTPKTPQSWDLYSYVRNNPLNATDPDGRLLAPWHFLITLLGGHAQGYSWRQSLSLAVWDVKADFKKGSLSSNAQDANVHAMIGRKNGRWQTAAEARSEIGQSLSTNVAKNTTESVGTALHTLQDMATPLHLDHQWRGMGLNLESVRHLLGDAFPSSATVDRAVLTTMGVVEQVRQSNEEIATAPEDQHDE